MRRAARLTEPVALYQSLAEEVAQQIQSGVLRTGDRIPSVRQMSTSHNVSAATVLQAYHLLEARGLISTRPRSGYFVNAHLRSPLSEPASSTPSGQSTAVDVIDLVFEVLAATKEAAEAAAVVPLGSAFPSPLLFPLPKLARTLSSTARHLDPWKTVEDLPPGSRELRRLIARRYLDLGIQLGLDDIVITSGAAEALTLSLQAVTRPGDVVAVESPAFYGALQAVEMAGLRAVEIPVHSRDGLDLQALAVAIETQAIKACWFMTTFQNPVGSLMPVDGKRALAELLAKHRVPLIEDDVYAELYFGPQRPIPVKSFDEDGLILHCGSFSKCLAPGYRVGWVAAGRFTEEVRRRKFLSSISTNVVAQETLAEFMKHGGYDHHLRQLREAVHKQQAAMLDAIDRHFPRETRVTRPSGGYFLWLELPAEVDALELYRQSLAAGVSLAPGPMFSPQRGFSRHIRLNCGHPWNAALDNAVATVGQLVSAQVRAHSSG